MIAGIGLDVVELGRVRNVMNGPAGRRFAARVLTPSELERYETLAPLRALEFLAGRFAAKEAVVKALGCGIGETAGFHDIEVLPNGQGKPECRLSDAARERLGWTGHSYTVHVAITHERTLAAATAIVERM